MQRSFLIAAAVIALSACVLSACARKEVMPDADFAVSAASASLFEVRAGQLALGRASAPGVRHFARRVITDHGASGAALTTALHGAGAAQAADIALDAPHQRLYDDLAATGPEAFDDKYIDIQAQAYEQTVYLYQDYLETAARGPLREFAASTLPVLESHRSEVHGLDAAMHAVIR